MTRFWVGVSGFSYASWIGQFYPESTPAGKMLNAYSAKLHSVEVNSTFYHLPTQTTTSKWADSTSGDFRFSFKANRKITHFKKLKDAKNDFDLFLQGLKPLQEKLGCVLVQLPPYMRAGFDVLEEFLAAKPDSVRVALEFRHESWFSDQLSALLSKYDTALCVADTEDMKPVVRRTAKFTYVRLRRDLYSKANLKSWSERIHTHAYESGDCFVYFKHDETGKAAKMAVEFDSMLNN